MRVAVTGATGNVGTAVVRALLADSGVDEVVALARRRPADLPHGTRFVSVDVATDDLEPALAGVDALVHLAWMFQPTRRPEVTWRANAVGTSRVLEAAGRAGVRSVVHASSVGAYSPGVGHRVDESWPTHSISSAGYGREKAYAERVVDAFEEARPDIRVVRLRPAFVFQRAAASAQRRIFAGPFLPGSVLRPGLLPVLPWPRGLRFQAVHADDLAEAYRLAVTTDARGAYNVAAEPVIDGEVLASLLGSRSVEVAASAVRLVTDALWRLHLVPADPTLLDLVLSLPLLDTTRISTELGWSPRHSGTDAVAELLSGMRAGAGAPTPPLASDSPGRRLREVRTGMGEHYDTTLEEP